MTDLDYGLVILVNLAQKIMFLGSLTPPKPHMEWSDLKVPHKWNWHLWKISSHAKNQVSSIKNDWSGLWTRDFAHKFSIFGGWPPRNTPKLWNTQKLCFLAVKGTLISFHAKIEGSSSKIDLVMTILMICLIFKIFQFLDFLKIVKRPAIFQISIFFENSNVQHLRFY